MTAIGYELTVPDGAELHVCLVCGGLQLHRPSASDDDDRLDIERAEPRTIELRVVVSDERARA